VERSFDLTPSKPLRAQDAVAAILHTGDGRYLLQHRDAKRSIFYPDHWGCFGGALEPGEDVLQGLKRELHEELALESGICTFSHFGDMRFSVEPAGVKDINRFYYDVTIPAGIVAKLTLGEGAGMALVEGSKALHELRLVPYDAFHLWLHFYKHMLTP
jgi:8-oxo-dGTP pyrophosphatase MutT (NUDIX family)